MTSFNKYSVKSDHRRGDPKKSQWSVCTKNELDVFTYGLINDWVSQEEVDNPNAGGKKIKNPVVWSLHRGSIKSSCVMLGRDANNRNLYVAKYTTDHNKEWHGYPVACLEDHDKPPQKILDIWISEGLMSVRDVTNLNKGRLK